MKHEEKQKKPNDNQKKPTTFWIGIGAAALILILAVILIIHNAGEDENTDWAPVIPGETLATTSDNAEPTEEQDPSNDDRQELTDETEDGTETASTPSTSIMGNTIPTLGDEEPYEDWLAAAMIIGISMQYDDYEFLGIYTASETPLSAHNSSGGAYVVFNGNGEALALKSLPLEGERDERDTMDLYVPAIGYATYELIPIGSVPVASLNERKLEDLEDLIIASTQVSIIER